MGVALIRGLLKPELSYHAADSGSVNVSLGLVTLLGSRLTFSYLTNTYGRSLSCRGKAP